MSSPLFLGFTLGKKRLLPVPPPPSNYKDPEKIKAWLAEKAGELEAVSAGTPTTGTVTSFVLLRADGSVVTSADGGECAGPLIAAISKERGFDYDELSPMGYHSHRGYETSRKVYSALNTERPVIFGFDIGTCLRVAAVEAMQTRDIQVPLILYRGEHGFFDPYELMLHTEDRKRVSLIDLLRNFALLVDNLSDEQVASRMQSDPTYSAHLALELTEVVFPCLFP